MAGLARAQEGQDVDPQAVSLVVHLETQPWPAACAADVVITGRSGEHGWGELAGEARVQKLGSRLVDACGQLGPGVRNDASGSGRWKTPGMTYGWCHRDIKRTWTFIQSSKWALLAGLKGWEAEHSVPGRASRTMERARGVACERRRAGTERGGSIRGECGGRGRRGRAGLGSKGQEAGRREEKEADSSRGGTD